MTGNLRALCQRLKSLGHISTLAPGNRVLAAVVCRIIGENIPRTKKQRMALVYRFAAEVAADKIPRVLQGATPVEPKPKRPKTKAEFNAFYTSKPWRSLRYDALKKHGAACQCCGGTAKSTGSPLHVDHIKPRSKYPELELRLDNLQVLCEDCNMGKGGRDQTDWRYI